MFILSQKTPKKAKIKLILVFLTLFFIVPVLTFSSSKKQIFVDSDAKGTQNGSSSHPYRTIKQAIEKAHGKTEIIVARGTYHENITLKEDISLFGKDKNETIISADDNKPAVTMKDNTKIDKITIRHGDDGIHVEDNAEVEITNCLIKDNHDDGIDVDEGSTRNSEEVLISNNDIEKNGKAGIYSEKRRLVIVDNEISKNGTGGIDMEGGVSAWISRNEISENYARGIKLRIDNSDIILKSNAIKHNRGNGVETYFRGEKGKVSIEKTSLFQNSGWGILRNQKLYFYNNQGLWNSSLIFGNNNNIGSNGAGNISGIVQI